MYQFANNASTVISSPVAIGDGAITVADASEFPAVSPANPCFATIEQAPPDPETKISNPNIEIVLVTGIAGNTLTVLRGQDGTVAQAWIVGDYCENRINKAALDDFTQEEELTAALATKADQTALDAHVGDFANPHQVDRHQIGAAPQENGFENRTDSVLSFDDPTRTFTITPAVAEFSFWSGGVKFTKSAPESIVIPAVTGGYYFYYDQSGVLQTAMDWDDALYKDVAYVAATFLDAVHGETVILSDERHGTVMDYATVLSERATEGASYEAGLLPGDITPDGSGDLDIHAQISVGSGFYWNQDIRFEIPGKILPSDIPFVYREGAGQGTWHRVPANSFVCYTEGGSRPLWNEDTGTVFQLTEITNLDFICMHLYATNDPLQPWIWLIGQNRYVNLTQARQGALVEVNTINIGGYPAIEQMTVATFIVQGSDGYTNPVKARIRTTDTGADFIDWRNVRVGVGSTGGAVTAWGDITGDIVNQADLQAELDGKETAGAAATVQTNLDTHVGDLANPHAVTASQAGAEPDLGNPTVDGYVLSSTIAGVRSWVAGGGGSGGGLTISDTAPLTPAPGDLWMDSSDPSMITYAWYDDGNSTQWVMQSNPFATVSNALISNPDAGVSQSITAADPADVPLFVKGAALQTANLFAVQDNAGTSLLNVQPSGQTDLFSQNVTPLRTNRNNVGVAAGFKSNIILIWDESDDLLTTASLVFRGDASNDIAGISGKGGANSQVFIASSTDNVGNDGMWLNGTNIIFGDNNSAALGAQPGSVTISTGASGVTNPILTSDDLIIESAGTTGMTICSPNTNWNYIRFADPEDNDVGAIAYNHATDQMNIRVNASARLGIISDGTISVLTADYENLVLADDDIPNKKYVDDQYSWLVIAEEGVALDTTTNGGYQWSFGNGETNIIGFAVPMACEVTHLTLSEAAGTAITATVQLVKNGTPVVGATIALTAAASGVQVLGTPVAFAAGDTLTFVTSVGTAQGVGGLVTALCRAT